MSAKAVLSKAQPGANVETGGDKWFGPGRFALMLGLLVLVSFPGIVLGTQTFVFRDFGLFSYPVAFFQRQCFWKGELPLWNPLSQCGLPFLAQWNTLALYPPSLFYLLLPLTWALPVFCLAHLVWGGIGMYLLAERWTEHRLAAGLAAVIFAFNGLSTNFLMWPSHIATFSWVPWVWLLGQDAWRHGGKGLVWGAVAAALQMLAGAPETILSTWLIIVLLVGRDWIRREAPRFQLLARFGGLACLVALLSAAQLLPFFQLLGHSQRHIGYAGAGWSMPPWGWANFLVPLFRTSPTPQGVFLQDGQGWTSSYYVGIGTVLLGFVAVWRVRTWPVRALGIILCACLLLVLGNSGFLYPLLRFCFPPLGFMRFPIKFIILIAALAPLLAAYGLRLLLDRRPQAQCSTAPGAAEQIPTAPASRLRGSGQLAPGALEWGAALVLLLAILFIVLIDRDWANEVWRMTLKNGLLRAIFLILIFFLLRLLSRTTGRNRLLSGCLLLVLFWLDFRTHVPAQNPTASPEIYKPGWAATHIAWDPRPTLGQSRAMLGPRAKADLQFHALPNLDETYLAHRLGLLADCNLLDGIPQAHGFFSLAPAKTADLTAKLNEEIENFSPLLDFMGVSQISSPEKSLEWVARPRAMPVVTAGQRPVFADDSATCASFSNHTVNLREVVFLSDEARDHLTAQGQREATVSEIAWTRRYISFEAESPGPGLAVIAQTYYPAWKAYVDEKPVKIWRANYAFQAVELPAGRHSVRLAYEDPWLRAGVLLSVLGLTATVALWLFAHFRPGRRA